jgi:hypothetical protein
VGQQAELLTHILATPGDRVRALTQVSELAGITPVVLGGRASVSELPIWDRVAVA